MGSRKALQGLGKRTQSITCLVRKTKTFARTLGLRASMNCLRVRRLVDWRFEKHHPPKLKPFLSCPPWTNACRLFCYYDPPLRVSRPQHFLCSSETVAIISHQTPRPVGTLGLIFTATIPRTFSGTCGITHARQTTTGMASHLHAMRLQSMYTYAVAAAVLHELATRVC